MTITVPEILVAQAGNTLLEERVPLAVGAIDCKFEVDVGASDGLLVVGQGGIDGAVPSHQVKINGRGVCIFLGYFQDAKKQEGGGEYIDIY